MEACGRKGQQKAKEDQKRCCAKNGQKTSKKCSANDDAANKKPPKKFCISGGKYPCSYESEEECEPCVSRNPSYQ